MTIVFIQYVKHAMKLLKILYIKKKKDYRTKVLNIVGQNDHTHQYDGV